MKFKTIYILFNAVIVLSFCFIFLMPLILLGSDYFKVFLSKNWIAGVLFLVTLIIINGYFLTNWKLFRLLEKEDWHALIGYLEEKVYQKGKQRRSYIKMLINAYLVTSKVEKIAALETHLREQESQLLKTFALQLGIPYLLAKDPEAAEKYFGRCGEEPGVHHRGWLRWNYAFALMQQKAFDAAQVTLFDLLASDKDPVLILLTVYMLSSVVPLDSEERSRVEDKRRELAERYNPQQWNKKIESSGRHIQMVLLTPIIREARDWLFSKSGAGGREQSSQQKTVH
jgi:hypothetical protein